jgi:hypothetical protein
MNVRRTADEEAVRRGRGEDRERVVLARAGRVRAAEERDAVDEDGRGRDALERAADGEEDERASERGEAGDGRPEREPGVGAEEDALVPAVCGG